MHYFSSHDISDRLLVILLNTCNFTVIGYYKKIMVFYNPHRTVQSNKSQNNVEHTTHKQQEDEFLVSCDILQEWGKIEAYSDGNTITIKKYD